MRPRHPRGVSFVWAIVAGVADSIPVSVRLELTVWMFLVFYKGIDVEWAVVTCIADAITIAILLISSIIIA